MVMGNTTACGKYCYFGMLGNVSLNINLALSEIMTEFNTVARKQ
jgi:hypothetical protein